MREYKNGFIILNSDNQRRLLVYMDARKISLYDKEREDYIKFYKKEQLTGLAFENEIYYPFEDLEILKQYPFIKQLLIGQRNIKKLEGIKYIKKLEELHIEDNLSPINLDQLKHSLKDLALTWHKQILNLDSLNNLKELHIEKDNQEVILPSNIKILNLWKSKRENLNFCGHLSSLKKLTLYNNKKLSNIEGLVFLRNTLESLEIEKCKNILDYSPILKLKKLKTLQISSYNKNNSKELKKLTNLNIQVSIYPKLK